jgi:acetyl-CoA synthetase (ADP-forming)
MGWMRGVIEVLRRVNSIAIVGASPIRGRVGYELLSNVVKYGFRGRVYPVNPKYGEVLGFRCYSSPRDIPDDVDVAVIAIPAPQVPKVLEELCGKGVKLAVVISAGFRERGRVELEERLLRVSRDCGIRLVGPNSAGVTSTPARLHASIEVLPSEGSVAVVSHSGAVGGVAIYELQRLGSGVSYFISLGNSLDVSLEEVLEELAEDSYTDSVVAYVEWVKEGRRFIEALRRLSRSKPVSVVKGGWGRASSEAVKTHTGGMATPYELFRAAVRQAGAYLAEEVDEAVEVAELLRKLRAPSKARRVLVVTNSGGYGILTSSHLEVAGAEVAPLTEDLAREIEAAVSKEFSGVNPVDLGGDSKAVDVVRVLSLNALRERYDLTVVVYVPTSAETPEEICEAFKKAPEVLPTVYLVAGGGSTAIARCLSKVKPVARRPSSLAKVLEYLWGARWRAPG